MFKEFVLSKDLGRWIVLNEKDKYDDSLWFYLIRL